MSKHKNEPILLSTNLNTVKVSQPIFTHQKTTGWTAGAPCQHCFFSAQQEMVNSTEYLTHTFPLIKKALNSTGKDQREQGPLAVVRQSTWSCGAARYLACRTKVVLTAHVKLNFPQRRGRLKTPMTSYDLCAVIWVYGISCLLKRLFLPKVFCLCVRPSRCQKTWIQEISFCRLHACKSNADRIGLKQVVFVQIDI